LGGNPIFSLILKGGEEVVALNFCSKVREKRKKSNLYKKGKKETGTKRVSSLKEIGKK